VVEKFPDVYANPVDSIVPVLILPPLILVTFELTSAAALPLGIFPLTAVVSEPVAVFICDTDEFKDDVVEFKFVTDEFIPVTDEFKDDVVEFKFDIAAATGPADTVIFPIILKSFPSHTNLSLRDIFPSLST